MGDNDTSKKKKTARKPVGCKILGAAVEEIRLERGQTVDQLLEGSEVTPSTYYRWFKGESMPGEIAFAKVFAGRRLAPEEWDRLMAIVPAGLARALGDRPVRAVEPVIDDWALSELAALFRVARVRRLASVNDMADAAGISRSTWRNWSSGIALPVPSLSRTWARSVGLSSVERAEFGMALAAVYFGPASVSVEGDCDGLDVARVDARTGGGADCDCDGGGEGC
jgi:transcriptional regulator with XRE-family HTH domain